MHIFYYLYTFCIFDAFVNNVMLLISNSDYLQQINWLLCKNMCISQFLYYHSLFILFGWVDCHKNKHLNKIEVYFGLIIYFFSAYCISLNFYIGFSGMLFLMQNGHLCHGSILLKISRLKQALINSGNNSLKFFI